MLQNLGLNRNCDDWNVSDAEKENRKRCFFCCFVVDRLSCAMYGRTPVLDERDYDTPYPSGADEDDPVIMENFHQLIKLAGILGSILRQLYTVYGRHQLSIMSTPDRIISSLDKELNGWLAKLPPSIQYRPPNTRNAESAPAPSIEICQLHMLYYTALALLHRPFIPGKGQTASLSVFPSSAICTFAANKILDIAVSLMDEGRLKNINSYALYFMFTAGTIFINDASSPDSMFALDSKISVNKIMRAMEHVESTWRTSARHTNILGELAGLRDINLEDCTRPVDYKQRPEPQWTAAIAVPNSPEAKWQPDTGMPQSSIPQAATSQPAPQAQQPYDPIATAFWGVPTSFDIDEWQSYFSLQNQQQ